MELYKEKKRKELFEILADIEHQRWSDWQKYIHSKCVKVVDVVDNQSSKDVLREILIPLELFNQWERQINTPYKDLSEKEKESDREQVKRYWDLIEPKF